MQRRLASTVRKVHVRSVIDDVTDHVVVSTDHGHGKRGFSVEVLNVEGKVEFYKSSEEGEVGFACGPNEGSVSVSVDEFSSFGFNEVS